MSKWAPAVCLSSSSISRFFCGQIGFLISFNLWMAGNPSKNHHMPALCQLFCSLTHKVFDSALCTFLLDLCQSRLWVCKDCYWCDVSISRLLNGYFQGVKDCSCIQRFFVFERDKISELGLGATRPQSRIPSVLKLLMIESFDHRAKLPPLPDFWKRLY